MLSTNIILAADVTGIRQYDDIKSVEQRLSAPVTRWGVGAVLAVLALNTHSGFLGVSRTLRMAGANHALTGISYVLRILVPATFQSILTGLKIGGICLADTDCGRTRLRRFIGTRRHLPVHLRKSQPARYSRRLCGAFDRHHHRPDRRKSCFSNHERHTIQKWGMKE